MPGKRASKETSRTPRASVPRDGQRGERRCGQAGRCHRPRRGETTGRDALGTGEQEAARESIWKLPPQ